MPSSIMYDEEENFVVLDPNLLEEELMSADELVAKLKNILSQIPVDDLDRDLKKITSLDDRAKYLLATSCEFPLEPGKTLQWYAVRLEK